MKKLQMILGVFLILLIFAGCGDKKSALAKRVGILQEEAQLAIKNNNFEVAEKKLLEAHDLDPSQQHIMNNLAVLYVQNMKKPQKAKEIWEELLEETPHNSAYMNNLAGIYLSEQNFDRAIELYQRAKEHAPSYHLPFYNISRILMVQKKYEEAIRELKSGLKLAPDDSTMIITLTTALVLDEKVDEALSFLETKVKKVPDVGEMITTQIRLKRRLKMYDDALKIIDKEFETNPINSILLVEKTEIYLAMDKSQEEIRRLLDQIRATPNSVHLAFYYDMVEARLKMKMGESDAALEKMESVLKEIPMELSYIKAIASYSLGEAYLKKGDTEKASEYFKMAGNLEPIVFSGWKNDVAPETNE